MSTERTQKLRGGFSNDKDRPGLDHGVDGVVDGGVWDRMGRSRLSSCRRMLVAWPDVISVTHSSWF